MNTKALLMGFVLTVSLSAASPASSQQAPPPSEKAKQTEALVNKAAALIDKNGKASPSSERKTASGFMTMRICSRTI